MSSRLLPIALCIIVLTAASHADTLQQLVEKTGVPSKNFSAEELAAEVDGAVLSDAKRIVIAYGQVDRLSGVALVGARSVVKFDKASGSLQRGVIPEDQTTLCGGAPIAIQTVNDFLLVSTHINPSAGCILVLDDQLRLHKTLFGGNAGNSPVRIGAAGIVIIENTIHFAPVHPERLQLVDLQSWVQSELYPARGDILRRRLISQNAAHMPPRATCAALNEDCDPDFFDEDIHDVVSDGQNRLAFLVTQEASHRWKEGEAPQMAASQTVFYFYQRKGNGWRYCQEELKAEEALAVANQLHTDFAKTSARCVPTKVVFPDLRTQKYNPFLSH